MAVTLCPVYGRSYWFRLWNDDGFSPPQSRNQSLDCLGNVHLFLAL